MGSHAWILCSRLPICTFTLLQSSLFRCTHAHPNKLPQPLEDNLLRCTSKRTSAKTAPWNFVCVCANNMPVHAALFCLWVLADTGGEVSQFVGCNQIGKIQFHRCNYFAPVTQCRLLAVGSFYAIFNTLTGATLTQPCKNVCGRGY